MSAREPDEPDEHGLDYGDENNQPEEPATPEAGPTTTIRVVVGEIPRMVRQAIAALAERDPNLYQRSGELVRITSEPQRAEYDRDERTGADILMRPGTPRLRGLPLAVLVEHLATAAEWLKIDGRRKVDAAKGPAWVAADPPERVAAIVHARADWPDIRPVRGILETPSLRPDGTVIEAPGYDLATGFVLLPSCAFPPVPDRPSRAEGAAALRRLWIELFCDFPFQGLGEADPEDGDRADRYLKACRCPDAFVALAALLTIIARPAILGAVPGFIFEAATQGSGKTLQMNLVSIVATGRPAGMMTFPMSRSLRGEAAEPNEEELEKVLSAYALAGARVIAFDNIKGTLGGAALEKCATAIDSIDLRVLGASDTRTMPWSAVLLYSGNNLTMSNDMAQRALVSRIESDREDPRSRPVQDFRHPDLLGAAKRFRPGLVRDALTVLRAFVVSPKDERPDCGTWGSFTMWARLVPHAIAYAGGPNILGARAGGAELAQDAEAEAHLVLMRQWPGAADGTKAGELVSKLFEHEHQIQRGQASPDGRDELRAAVRTFTRTPEGKIPNGVAFGKVLARLRGKIRSGYKLVGERDRTGVVVWRVIAPAPLA